MKIGVFNIVIALLILVVNGFPSIWDSNAYRFSQIIRLGINAKKIKDKINAINPDENGFKFFNAAWDGFMLNGIDLVYDESEEISLHDSRRSSVRTPKLNQTQYKGCRVMPLISYFYLVNC